MPLTVNTNSFQVGGVGPAPLDPAVIQAEIVKSSPYKHLQTVNVESATTVLLDDPEIANYSSTLIILDSLKLGPSQYQGIGMRFIQAGVLYTASQYSYSYHGTNEVGSRIGGGGVNQAYGQLIIQNASYMPFDDVGGQIVCTGMKAGSRKVAISRIASGRSSPSDGSEKARAHNSTVTTIIDGYQCTGFELFPVYSSPQFVSGRISIYGLSTHD